MEIPQRVFLDNFCIYELNIVWMMSIDSFHMYLLVETFHEAVIRCSSITANSQFLFNVANITLLYATDKLLPISNVLKQTISSWKWKFKEVLTEITGPSGDIENSVLICREGPGNRLTKSNTYSVSPRVVQSRHTAKVQTKEQLYQNEGSLCGKSLFSIGKGM